MKLVFKIYNLHEYKPNMVYNIVVIILIIKSLSVCLTLYLEPLSKFIIKIIIVKVYFNMLIFLII